MWSSASDSTVIGVQPGCDDLVVAQRSCEPAPARGGHFEPWQAAGVSVAQLADPS